MKDESVDYVVDLKRLTNTRKFFLVCYLFACILMCLYEYFLCIGALHADDRRT